MTVGDINSREKGSAARYNEGKAPLQFIPIRQCLDLLVDPTGWLFHVLKSLAEYQETGHSTCMYDAITQVPQADIEDAARVFEYGAKKYAHWNWCKGQQWTVTLGSLLRHAFAMLHEEMDPESGLPHSGHIVCNLLMLAWYMDEYPEGQEGFFINTELKA